MHDPSAEVASPPALLARDVPERMPLPGPVGVFVNVRARLGDEGFREARRALTRAGIACEVCATFATPEVLLERLEQALGQGLRLAIVGGGDGTVRGVAATLIHHRAILGVLPLGTGNDFARALGIPFDVRRAVEAIVSGTTAQVDVGVANGRPFLNAVSVGVSAELARKLGGSVKRRLGPFAYPLGAALTGWRMRPFEARIEVDGEELLHAPVWQLVVGNSRYQGGGRVISPRAAPDDHRLDGYAVLSRGGRRDPDLVRDWLTLARVGFRTRTGSQVLDPAVVAFRGSRVRLETSPRQPLNADGDLCGETPADVAIFEGSLSVRVPNLARLRRSKRRSQL